MIFEEIENTEEIDKEPIRFNSSFKTTYFLQDAVLPILVPSIPSLCIFHVQRMHNSFVVQKLIKALQYGWQNWAKKDSALLGMITIVVLPAYSNKTISRANVGFKCRTVQCKKYIRLDWLILILNGLNTSKVQKDNLVWCIHLFQSNYPWYNFKQFHIS
jgi:hypothetical protein